MARAGGAHLADALGGMGGAPARPGVLHVVAVHRLDPAALSVRGAVLLASADRLRVSELLPPDAGGPLAAGAAVTVADLPTEDDDVAALAAELAEAAVAGAAVVQLVAATVQTAPAVLVPLGRLREAGVTVELVPAVGPVEQALVAGGVAVGTARAPDDPRLDRLVLANDAPDLADWAKGLRARGAIARRVDVLLLERAGTPQQRSRVVEVGMLPELELAGPVVAVVPAPPVVVPWREDLALAGLTVWNPRAAHQAPALAAAIRAHGGASLDVPLLATDHGDLAALDTAVAALPAGDVALLCLTSPNGVAALAASLDRVGLDARALAGVGTVACVGPGTAAALRDALRVDADLVATVSTTEGLAADVAAAPTAGAVALLPRADIATEVLAEALAAKGYEVREVAAYRTVDPPTPPARATAGVAAGAVDLVALLSSSMARAYAAALSEAGLDPRRVDTAVVSIGPVTTATCEAAGVPVHVEADPHDLDGLVDALCRAGTAIRRHRSGLPPAGAP
ncbi:MAG: uroporphyrinogen-III synthase [Actinomycetes bacterium]